MKKIITYLIGCLLMGPLVSSCENQKQSQEVNRRNTENPQSFEDQLIEKHKANNRLEDTAIDQYVLDQEWDEVNKTGTGLRYWIYDEVKSQGDLAKSEQLAIFKYQVYLLNGDLCYDNNGLVDEMYIDHDEGPTGLHEGLKLMRVGEKAKFVLPARLAYGLTGDQNKIPMNCSIVYDVQLLGLQ